MKTLHIYLTRQVLGSLLMAMVVFTFVLLVGNFLKEILPMLISGQVSLQVVATAVGLLVPFVWVFALPMALLTATLLIFGRFSADQEYTAVRASGVSLLAVASPILLLSVALCGLSALVNMELGPRCRVAYTTLRYKLLSQLSGTQLPEGRMITDLKGYIFYIGRNRQGELEDIKAFTLGDGTNAEYTIQAPRGKLEVDPPNRRMVLTLFNARMVALGGKEAQQGVAPVLSIEFPLEDSRKAEKPNISDLTFLQLRSELRGLERGASLPVSLKGLTPEQLQAHKKQWDQFRNEVMGRYVFNMHRQVAFSFACFGFTLLGIPLAIRVHRRETNVGIALALILVAVYLSFVLVGQALEDRPQYLPHLIVWLPNFLFQGAGAFLLWRANRGI